MMPDFDISYSAKANVWLILFYPSAEAGGKEEAERYRNKSCLASLQLASANCLHQKQKWL
jgi:hypothetical protein